MSEQVTIELLEGFLEAFNMASPRVLASYSRKTMFFVLIGLLFGLLTGIRSDYPPADALLKALYEIMFWTVTGLVVAWRLRPAPTPPAEK